MIHVTHECLPYLTSDEVAAWAETDDWLNAEASRFKKVMGFTRKPIEYAYSKVPESVRESIASAIFTVLTSVRDGSAGLVSVDAVREKIGPIADHEHGIFQVDVRRLDAVAQSFIGQSKNACMAEGAAAGIAGLPGIVVDIPALYGLLFRMIAQVAACYGYSADEEQERTHILKILDIGHQMEPEPKRQGMAEIAHLQQMIRDDVPVVEVQRFAVSKGLQTMARHLGLALTQRKLAQTVVLMGGVVGAGVNRQLASEVGEVAFHAYRRRHLTELAELRRMGKLGSAEGVPASIVCSKCHQEVPDENRFCPNCGERVPTISPAQPLPPQPIPAQPPRVETFLDPEPTLEPLPGPAPRRSTVRSGQARISVDADTLNLLLDEFAGNDETRIRYRDGQVVVDRGGLRMALTSMPWKDTSLRLESALGTVHLSVGDLHLETQQVKLDLDVGLE